MNELLLHMLLPGLRDAFTGRRITGAFWSEPILNIEFASQGLSCLVVILSDPGPFLFPSDTSIVHSGSLRVFEEIEGSVLSEVSIPGQDRTLTLSGAGNDGDWTLSLLLFGSSGCAILHRDEQVIRSVGGNPDRFREVLDHSGKRLSILTIHQDALEDKLNPDDQSAGQVPGLDSRFADGFRSSTGRCDVAGLIEFRNRLLSGKESFRLYLPDRPGRAFPVSPSPAVLRPSDSILGPFVSAGEACHELGMRLIKTAQDKILEKQARPLRKRLKARQALRSRLQQDLDSAADHHRLRRETEALAAYQARIKPGSGTVELPDPYDPDTTLTINLDPAVAIPEQIRKRFKRATKLERSGDKIKRRLAQIDSELIQLGELLAQFEVIGEFNKARKFIQAALESMKLSRSQATLKKNQDQVKTYRRFEVHPGWFVLVGRSNKENDEITFKVAGPDDLWFHAQNVPGSHVVLKSRGGKELNPPRQVLALTAGIAAFYSKSRHASLVPVIFTRRKYVRKPRKAPPGQVICEREKTVFAEPALPPSFHPIDDQ